MFTKDEATAERIGGYLEALEAEKEQLQVALTQETDAGNDARVKRLEKRGKANAAEIARVEKLKGGSSRASGRSRSPKKDAAGDAGSEEGGDA